MAAGVVDAAAAAAVAAAFAVGIGGVGVGVGVIAVGWIAADVAGTSVGMVAIGGIVVGAVRAIVRSSTHTTTAVAGCAFSPGRGWRRKRQVERPYMHVNARPGLPVRRAGRLVAVAVVFERECNRA
jgi:hypothetical protein